jgi:hypothetical protein
MLEEELGQNRQYGALNDITQHQSTERRGEGSAKGRWGLRSAARD